MFECFEITLPLPTSVNRCYEVGRNFKGGQIIRTAEYTAWIAEAKHWWTREFNYGVKKLFAGRLRCDYVFMLNQNDKIVAHGSDISNREKPLSDFLEKKFYLNDNQIDEQHHYRRLTNEGPHRVMVRVTEIPDRRWDDPMLIFNPKT